MTQQLRDKEEIIELVEQEIMKIKEKQEEDGLEAQSKNDLI